MISETFLPAPLVKVNCNQNSSFCSSHTCSILSCYLQFLPHLMLTINGGMAEAVWLWRLHMWILGGGQSSIWIFISLPCACYGDSVPSLSTSKRCLSPYPATWKRKLRNSDACNFFLQYHLSYYSKRRHYELSPGFCISSEAKLSVPWVVPLITLLLWYIPPLNI